MSRVARLAIASVCAALIPAVACSRPAGVPRLAYVYAADGGGQRVAKVAQILIDGWRQPRVAEIIVASTASDQLSEASRNVEFANSALQGGPLAGAAGHLGSRTTLLVAPMYVEAHVPLVVPTATSRRIGQLGAFVFPLAPNEDAEGEFLVNFATARLGLKRLTVVYLSADEYGTGLRDGVVAALRRRNLAPVEQVGVLDDSDHDRMLTASIGRAMPDGLILAVGPASASKVLESLDEHQLKLPVIAGDSVELVADYLHAIRNWSANLYVAAFWHPEVPRPESKAFLELYRREAGVPPPSGTNAMFFDSLMMLATAVRDVGPRGDDVSAYLLSLGVSRPPYQGITGPLSFQPRRPVNLVMTRVRDGASVLAEGR